MTTPSTPTDVPALRLYTNDTDTVVAASVDDAWDVWEAHTGEEYERDWEWEAAPDDEVIAVWCDTDGDVCEPDEDGADVVRKTAAEWVAKLGRGFAWSTEF